MMEARFRLDLHSEIERSSILTTAHLVARALWADLVLQP